MISVPIAVNNEYFRPQLELFWFNHLKTYGESAAREKALAVIIKRNGRYEQRRETCDWAAGIPHSMAEAYFDVRSDLANSAYLPINIQVGLSQVIDKFADEQVIEVLDCDMFHLKPHPEVVVADDELIVTDIYEAWHLLSLTDYRHVIAPFFKNGGGYYNGGFVPIIGKAKTFKKLLPAWTDLHKRIVDTHSDGNLQWWAGMYALQAACENHAVWMRAMDLCYVPAINDLSDEHYIAHYSVDQKFNKKAWGWPKIDVSSFEDNNYYHRVLEWMRQARIITDDSPPRYQHHPGSQL